MAVNARDNSNAIFTGCFMIFQFRLMISQFGLEDKAGPCRVRSASNLFILMELKNIKPKFLCIFAKNKIACSSWKKKITVHA
jgi:hypothetical protein